MSYLRPFVFEKLFSMNTFAYVICKCLIGGIDMEIKFLAEPMTVQPSNSMLNIFDN